MQGGRRKFCASFLCAQSLYLQPQIYRRQAHLWLRRLPFVSIAKSCFMGGIRYPCYGLVLCTCLAGAGSDASLLTVDGSACGLIFRRAGGFASSLLPIMPSATRSSEITHLYNRTECTRKSRTSWSVLENDLDDWVVPDNFHHGTLCRLRLHLFA